MQVVSGSGWAFGLPSVSGHLTDRKTLAKLGNGLRRLYQNIRMRLNSPFLRIRGILLPPTGDRVTKSRA